MAAETPRVTSSRVGVRIVFVKNAVQWRFLLIEYVECSMTESEFLSLAESCLNQVENMFEQAFERDELDVECSRSGNVLTIEFVENGSKMIVNSQAPMQEMWLAARAGGFHYRYDGQQWLNTRDGSELFATLSRLAQEQNR